MTTTISLSDEQWQKLEAIAISLKLTPEQLVQVNIQEALAKTEDDFKHAADYVLRKIAELYQRLA
ncbi:MAG TPA: DNA-binding protein [Chloroflexia bacterium]|nr:DNA-binding protein [Chloroflexia bacterium]